MSVFEYCSSFLSIYIILKHIIDDWLETGIPNGSFIKNSFVSFSIFYWQFKLSAFNILSVFFGSFWLLLPLRRGLIVLRAFCEDTSLVSWDSLEFLVLVFDGLILMVFPWSLWVHPRSVLWASHIHLSSSIIRFVEFVTIVSLKESLHFVFFLSSCKYLINTLFHLMVTLKFFCNFLNPSIILFLLTAK